MVVGANGTGKSTILNAICLGLGGEPKVLGRADDLRAFIMHGKNQAEIEIELTPRHPEDEPILLERYIDRNKGSDRGRGRGASSIYVNGKKSNAHEVRDLVMEQYNIQIDNLCTFLPQDKVGNFSGFTDQERLLETEKTLPRNQYFYKKHMELIAKEEEMSSYVSNVESTKDKLARKNHDCERLEVGRVREEERVMVQEQLQLLQKKQLWLEFDAEREKCVALKQRKDEIKVEIRAAKQEIQPLQDQLRELQEEIKELEAKSQTLERNTHGAVKEMDKQRLKFERHDDDMEAVIAQLMELDSVREKLEDQLNQAKLRLEEFEQQIATFPPMEDLHKQYSEAKALVRTLRTDYEKAKREDRQVQQKFTELEENAVNLQNNLAKLNDDGARRRETVLRQAPNLAKICQWIDENRSRFRRPVWGPVAVEITPKSQNTAAYVEFHIPNNYLKSFVVETNEDRELLFTEIREKLNIPINILNVDGSRLETARMYSNEKMTRLQNEVGVECYLDQTFVASEPVMIALQKFAAVHKVIVGGEVTQDSIERKGLRDYLAQPEGQGNSRLQTSCVFAAKGNHSYRYTQTVSSYSGKVNSKMDQVGQAKLLAPGVPQEQKQRVEDDLSNVHAEMADLRPTVLEATTNLDRLERSTQNEHAKTVSIKDSIDNYNLFYKKYDRQKVKVEEAAKKLEKDETQEKEQLVKNLLKRLSSCIAAIKSHGEQHKMMLKFTVENAGMTVDRTALNAAERSTR